MELTERIRLAPLFAGHRDIRVVIDAVLEGRAGSVVTDDAASPSVARLRIGCYDIFGGSPSTPAARDWIAGVPAPREFASPEPDHPAWSELAAEILGERLRPRPMRTFDPGRLDMAHLRAIAASVPDGFGFAARQGDALACAATSYAACSHGVEVAIATHPRFRGRGLAASVSAAFMLHALERGLVPQWSASNPVSQRLAGRFGYLPARVCPLLYVH